LAPAERAAIVGRMDAGTAADWAAWERDLDPMLTAMSGAAT